MGRDNVLERSRKRDFDSRQQGGGYASHHSSYNDHRTCGPEEHSYEEKTPGVRPRRTTSTLRTPRIGPSWGLRGGP